MDTLWDSVVKVTWDPDGAATVLVNWDDPMWEPVTLDGKQVVQEAPGLRRAGVDHFPRGNERHELRFTLARETAGIAAAFQARLTNALAVPRTRRDVLLSFESGAAFRLRNCAVESWPSGQVEHLTKETLVIRGGELVLSGTAGPDPVGLEGALLNLAGGTGTLDAGGAAAEHLDAVATWQNGGTGVAATQTTAGERPVLLSGTGIWMPGTAGNYTSLADSVQFVFATSFALRVDARLPSYRPAARVCLVSKWTEAGDQRSWRLLLETDGTLTLEWSTDGTAATIESFSSALPLPLGAWEHLRVQVRKDTNTLLGFYIFDGFEGTTPYELGAPYTAGVPNNAPFTSTAPVNIGASEGGTVDILRGFVLQWTWWKNSSGSGFSGQTATVNFTLVDVSFDSGLPLVTLPGFTVAVNTTGLDPARLVFGPVLRFDGTDDNMSLATPAKLNAVAGATIVWFGRLNRVTGTQDLVFCGTVGTNPRLLLRADGTDLELHVRRLDAEATASIPVAGALAALTHYVIIASIDFNGGLASIYIDGVLAASGSLTSAGSTSATDSSETRIMAGQAEANPAAGDVNHILVTDEATPFAEVPDLYTTILNQSR
jgi:hypothetical protein